MYLTRPSGMVAGLLLLLLAPCHVCTQSSTIDLIPKSAPLAMSFSISEKDEGITWLVKRLKSYLLSRYSGDEGIEDFTFLAVDEMAFGIIPEKSSTYSFILSARLVDKGEPIRIKSGKHDIRLNIRNKDTARKFKRSILVALLELLIEKGSESSEKVSSARGDIQIDVKVSSYAFLGDDVVVGSSLEALKASKMAFAHKSERLSSSAPYRDIGSRLFESPSDLVVFVDNSGDDFKKYVTLCRGDWGQTLLGMTESVDYLGVAADIIDSDSMKARIVAHSVDKARARTTQASAEANLPLFLKKYLGGRIDYKFNVGRDGLYVTIDVDVNGLSGYWDRLFEIKDKGRSG